MRSKLHAIAQTFVEQLGSDLQRYTFVFPNHRAGLFFRKYLSQYVDKPMFAPRMMSINECFAELSDLLVADQLTLLLRLYSEYRRLKPDAESLDQFLYWGKMMLADFSEIDNHLVPHVEALFASVKDLHTIDERFQYLTDNQRQALARFWKEFQESDKHHPNGEMHQRFLHTWDLLYPLYTALRENLLRDGLAYEGMLHREVLDHWQEIPLERFREQYVFLGFNALTASERELMLRLQEMGRADFYFDYDSPYLRDPQNKASLFMEENLRLFQSRFPIPESRFSTPASGVQIPDITLVSVPSTVGEVHEVNRILSGIILDDCSDLTRTAIVLPDERLLVPLLNTFPESVSKINVTMGYPLRATSLYTAVVYPEQVLQPMPTSPAEFISQMQNHLYAQLDASNSDAIYQLSKVLDCLEIALTIYPQIVFTVADMHQLLRMLTMESTIPYVGEPLDGLQVMGVLETRALDFDNVIITGFNDELYPGKTRANSFVPYTLRCGFNLPTQDRQNAIFAYNFYRMLSYAKHVWLIHNSTADDQHSGEVSRFFYQLKWQYGLNINQFAITNELISAPITYAQGIKKDNRLNEIRTLSATALTTYLRCPKLFYYKYIECLHEPAPDETISASELTIGNVLHATMEQLYAPLVGKNVTASDVEQLLAQVNDDTYWENIAHLQLLNGDVLANHVVRTYVNNILNNDYFNAPFQYIASEKQLNVNFNNIRLHGIADRIDMKGDILRMIDYKTGKTDLVYDTMANVFGIVTPEKEDSVMVRNKGKRQILQTLLYCWLYATSCGESVQIVPYIYPARKLAPEDMPAVEYKGRLLVFDKDIQQEFVSELQSLLDEMFDMNQPFYPTTDLHTCESCAFAQLCKG